MTTAAVVALGCALIVTGAWWPLVYAPTVLVLVGGWAVAK